MQVLWSTVAEEAYANEKGMLGGLKIRSLKDDSVSAQVFKGHDYFTTCSSTPLRSRMFHNSRWHRITRARSAGAGAAGLGAVLCHRT